jgi:nitrite reductase/ring-hydroxylating ferredoxin subunit
LASGVLICGTVQCPWHGSQFDVKTGVVKAGPAKETIKVHQIKVSGNRIFLTLDSTSEPVE